ncbi:GDSL esterase/lipase [Hibiscus syriacus]|uniref:GDSL esterase/lipase n=1 Tax=Hibiscus syriacus TaxID=106335 RepID=A0A6A2Y5F5_HIBSY|nr:GDSL esterase/lipase At5g03610-like [Hibiscus syriacus]KAE8679400.1 GDSL esterase/lipase [Hibiscus syriacus]
MVAQNLVFFFCCFFFISVFSEEHGVEGLGRGDKRLFVFGDSYADTGNNRIALASSWKFPYGITFPGKPAGRFSDGRVSTDFIAGYLGMKTPIPYRWRKQLAGRVKYGLNFAYGGTGVFDTSASYPNMTTQIHFLQQLINDSVYNKRGLKASLAFVSASGNDYANYIAMNGSTAGFPAFISSVVRQLTVSLRRIHGLGVGKIAVGSLPPLGCLPANTAQTSFQRCDPTQNALVDLHNLLLLQAVTNLNNQTNSTSFFILDFHGAFSTVLNQTQPHQGSPKFEKPLQACCMGVSAAFSCGSVDENGVKKYTLCSNPKSKFFWDTLHPTQEGWRAAFSTPAFQNSFNQLFQN